MMATTASKYQFQAAQYCLKALGTRVKIDQRTSTRLNKFVEHVMINTFQRRVAKYTQHRKERSKVKICPVSEVALPALAPPTPLPESADAVVAYLCTRDPCTIGELASRPAA